MRKLAVGILFVICHLSFGFYSFAEAKEYDGVWFLGFNLKSAGASQIAVRQTLARTISVEYIAAKIISDEAISGSVIPPGMDGYSALPALKQDLQIVKILAQKIKLRKNYVLLHTDGVKTREIVNKIREDLGRAGIAIKTKQIDYARQDEWEKELKFGKHDLFLMGYKADDPSDTLTLLKPLFYSKGSANFTFYKNRRVDQLIDQLPAVKDAKLKTKKLVEINQIIFSDKPAIPLFYITRL